MRYATRSDRIGLAALTGGNAFTAAAALEA
jgi:hypothetical protein